MIWFRKKARGLQSPQPVLRTALLCERTLAELADLPDDDPDTPHTRFHAARASQQVGDRATARRHLHDLLALPMVSTPTKVQVWSCLRELDELPAPAAAGVVRGVVVDIGLPQGLQTVAAYDDHTAALIRPDGDFVAADVPGGRHVDAIDALLAAARRVVTHTDPHRGPAENPPDVGHACIRVLTFAGVHLGLGPIPSLERDAVGGAVLAASKALAAVLGEKEEAAH